MSDRIRCHRARCRESRPRLVSVKDRRELSLSGVAVTRQLPEKQGVRCLPFRRGRRGGEAQRDADEVWHELPRCGREALTSRMQQALVGWPPARCRELVHARQRGLSRPARRLPQARKRAACSHLSEACHSEVGAREITTRCLAALTFFCQ